MEWRIEVGRSFVGGVGVRDKKVSRRREKGQEEDNNEREEEEEEGGEEEVDKVKRGSRIAVLS